MQNESTNEHLSPDAEFDGEFTGDDFVIPRWRIDKQTGMFVNSVTGASKESITAVILRIGRSRILWGKFQGSDTELLCYSTDGIEPADQDTPYGFVDAQRKICNGCPKAEWLNGKRPECSALINYLMLEPSSNVPSVLSLSGVRLRVAKSLNTLVKFSGVKTWIEFSTELQNHPNGDFYQLHFSEAEYNTEWLEYARQIMKTKTLRLTSPEQPDNEASPSIDPETGEVL